MMGTRRIRLRREHDLSLKNPCTEPRSIPSTGGGWRVLATNAHGLLVLCDPAFPLRPLSFLREPVSMILRSEPRQREHPPLSFVRAGRRSSIPETAVMDTTVRGVLDTPQVRGMTIPYAAMLLLLAILIQASPAFAEPCSRPTARSKIVEALPRASEQ